MDLGTEPLAYTLTAQMNFIHTDADDDSVDMKSLLVCF